MRRATAEKLIGSMVITGMVDGACYIGELVEVIPSKPFRANVIVHAVYSYPELYAHNTRGKFHEKRIELGESLLKDKGVIVNTGSGIESYTDIVPSYEESVVISIEKYLKSVKRTLDNYIENNGSYHTYYIDNMDETKQLYSLLCDRLQSARQLLV